MSTPHVGSGQAGTPCDSWFWWCTSYCMLRFGVTNVQAFVSAVEMHGKTAAH